MMLIFLENSGQNGQRSHFLTAVHDQNDRARGDNDFKHTIQGTGWLKIGKIDLDLKNNQGSHEII